MVTSSKFLLVEEDSADGLVNGGRQGTEYWNRPIENVMRVEQLADVSTAAKFQSD